MSVVGDDGDGERVRVWEAFMQVSVDVCVVVRTEGDWSILCLFSK